jgi:hypothetical protein
VVRPGAIGVLTNTASTTAAVTDPLKANNTASVKTTVVSPIAISVSGSTLTITTLGLPGSILESTPSLSSPVVWTTLMVNPPTVVNVPISSGSTFYRLRPGP